MLLEIKDLAITYGNNPKPTISDVSLTLEEGEVLSIVGESGSGKTTVIRAALGVLPNTGRVSAGEILFNGKNVLDYSKKEWLDLRGKDMAMIFQDSGNMMNPIQTIGKQFIEFIQVHSNLGKKEAEALAIEKLAVTNLANPENIMKSYPFELSGGMRQRVGIAMAITFSPKLLLADEPTSALDVTTQAQIVEEMLRIRKEDNVAMIVVTHNIGVAAYMSDKIMVMKHGAVIEYGPTAEIINHPKADYTKSLLAAVPELGGKRYV